MSAPLRMELADWPPMADPNSVFNVANIVEDPYLPVGWFAVQMGGETLFVDERGKIRMRLEAREPKVYRSEPNLAPTPGEERFRMLASLLRCTF